MLLKSTRPSEARRDEAVAVEQDDVADRAEAAKIDEGGAAVAVVDGRADRRNDARQFAKNFFGDVRLLELDRVRRGHVDRSRLLEVRVADQRAGDDDVFTLGSCFLGGGFLGGDTRGLIVGGRIFSRRGILRKGRGGKSHARDDGRRK